MNWTNFVKSVESMNKCPKYMKVRIDQKCEMYDTELYKKYESSNSVKNWPNWQHSPTNDANALMYSPTSVTTQASKKTFSILPQYK